ncbi:hypothetical protein ACIP9A_02320, partial [Streptomyces sp. NPDC088443]
MVIVFVLVAVLVLTVIVTANWYVWRRLFRDTTRGPGPGRRAGAALIAGGWVLAITALIAERSGAPFWLQQTLAWPGFLWLALSIYLLLAVLAGELVRPLLRRYLEHRDSRANGDDGAAEAASRAGGTAAAPAAPQANGKGAGPAPGDAGGAPAPATAAGARPDSGEAAVPGSASQPDGGVGTASATTAVPASASWAGGGATASAAASGVTSHADRAAHVPTAETTAPQANGSDAARAAGTAVDDAGGAPAPATAAGARSDSGEAAVPGSASQPDGGVGTASATTAVPASA